MSAVIAGEPTGWDCIERIVGPVQGYWLALCAMAAPDLPGHCIGYYKVCGHPPESYFETVCLFKGCAAGARRHPGLALHDAEVSARMATRNLPDARYLSAARERRPLNVYELHLLGARRRGR